MYDARQLQTMAYIIWTMAMLRCIPHIYNPSPKFTTDKTLKPWAEGEGFISGKLPMTEDEGCIYEEYTEV